MGSIPRSGRSPGGGHDNPLSILAWRIPMGREAWQAAVHRVTQSWTQLTQLSRHVQKQARGKVSF